MPKPPYEPARLVNGDEPVSKRWYIVFYVWDAQKEKLVRKRDYSINNKKTKMERFDYAKQRIRKINIMLERGVVFNPKEKKAQDVKINIEQKKDFTIAQAFKFLLPIIKTIKRGETFTSYNSTAGMFLKFCEATGWDKWKIKTLTQADIITWLDYVQVENKLGNSTRNNYKSFISGMFTMMKDRGILDANPAFGIKNLDVDVEGNIAFTAEQIKKLKPIIQDKAPRLWLYITFILYGFIRPKEISRLRVRMIDLEKNEIFLPGEITKNHKDKRVRISRPFKKFIEQLNLQDHKPNDYVFGFNLQTGSRAIQHNYAGHVHREILRAAGFGEGYGPYSWKHTGVINHYLAGIDIKTLQEQIGHQNLDETDIYLRGLGLYTNSEFEDKGPEI